MRTDGRVKTTNHSNGVRGRLTFLAFSLLGALAPLPGRGAVRAAHPTRLYIKSAALLTGRGPLTLHGDTREFVLARPDFSALKHSRSYPEAVVLHWPVTDVNGPMHGTTITFLRLLKAHPSRSPRAKVDWDPAPLLSADLERALSQREIRISGFSLAARNWASGKWPDYGMLIALNSLHRAAASVTLAAVDGGHLPNFELRWPLVLPGQPKR